MTRAFTLFGTRVTHDAADVATLEAANHDDPTARLRTLAEREDVAEAFLLQTCNRVEEYVVATTPDAGEAALSDFAPGIDPSRVERTGHEASLRHLLRVAAGLESQVVGEDQVLGQVRRAYARANDAGTVGPVLEAALLKAIHVGERARTETGINDGSVSLGAVAVQLADRERGLAGATVLLVGAGEMAGVVARGLVDAEVADLRIVNRSVSGADALAAELDGGVETGGLDDLAENLRDASVVVTSTASPEPVVSVEDVDGAGETFVVDLAQPRDVATEVAGRPGIEVHDLDALETVTEAAREERREAARAVEAIVDAEFDLLIDQYKRRRADAVIRGMYRGAEGIKERELGTALTKLEDAGELTDEQRAVVERLADALVSQLLAVPTKSLREAAAEDDWETIASAIQLFDPSLSTDEPPASLLALAAADQAAVDVSDD